MEIKDFENKRWKSGSQEIVFRHKAALGMVDAGKVLDLGCGDGLFLLKLRDKGIGGMGLDISEEAVRKCAASGLDAKVFDFTIQKLPFNDESYDCVAALDVLEHLFFPEKLLAEAKRVSREFIILSVPNFNSLPARLQVLFGKIPENNRKNKGHVYWFNSAVLKEILKNLGLKVVDFQVNTIWQSRPLIGCVLKTLARKFPSLFALSFVVKLKK